MVLMPKAQKEQGNSLLQHKELHREETQARPRQQRQMKRQRRIVLPVKSERKRCNTGVPISSDWITVKMVRSIMSSFAEKTFESDFERSLGRRNQLPELKCRRI